MNRSISVALGLAVSIAAPSQGKIIVVDAAMSAGANYSDIPAAVSNAVDGDRIVIRKGSYSKFLLAKGVAVIGEPGVKIPSAVVTGLAAGRIALLKNLDCSGDITIARNRGLVQLEGVRCQPLVTTGATTIRVIDAFQTYLSKCRATSFHARRSRSTLSKCDFDASRTIYNAMLLSRSDTMLAGCNLRSGTNNSIPNTAIQLSNAGNLVITDDGSSVIACNPSTTARVPAITGDRTGSNVVLDPRVVLRPTAGAVDVLGVNRTTRRVPFLEAKGGPLGGTVTVTLKGAANDMFFLAVGYPGFATISPQLLGTIWIDMKTVVLVRSGLLGTTGHYTYSTPVPRSNLLFGLTLVWQGVAGPATQMTLSNPSSYAHGR